MNTEDIKLSRISILYTILIFGHASSTSAGIYKINHFVIRGSVFLYFAEEL